MNFDQLTVLVTGAAGNLGVAVANAFAEQGANLVLINRSRESLVAAFESESEQRMFSPADLLDQAQVDAAVQSAIKRYQHIDVLCNIAGGFRMGEPVHSISDKDWDFLLDVNARTLLHAVRAVVPHMIERGSGKVVNVGAFTAQKGAKQMGAYIAAKSAVIRLTETMAAELREKNI